MFPNTTEKDVLEQSELKGAEDGVIITFTKANLKEVESFVENVESVVDMMVIFTDLPISELNFEKLYELHGRSLIVCPKMICFRISNTANA